MRNILRDLSRSVPERSAVHATDSAKGGRELLNVASVRGNKAGATTSKLPTDLGLCDRQRVAT